MNTSFITRRRNFEMDTGQMIILSPLFIEVLFFDGFLYFIFMQGLWQLICIGETDRICDLTLATSNEAIPR